MKFYEKEVNTMVFEPEETELMKEFVNVLLKQGEGESSFNEIRITSDGCCTVVNWINHLYDGGFEEGEFVYQGPEEEGLTYQRPHEETECGKIVLDSGEVDDGVSGVVTIEGRVDSETGEIRY